VCVGRRPSHPPDPIEHHALLHDRNNRRERRRVRHRISVDPSVSPRHSCHTSDVIVGGMSGRRESATNLRALQGSGIRCFFEKHASRAWELHEHDTGREAMCSPQRPRALPPTRGNDVARLRGLFCVTSFVSRTLAGRDRHQARPVADPGPTLDVFGTRLAVLAFELAGELGLKAVAVQSRSASEVRARLSLGGRDAARRLVAVRARRTVSRSTFAIAPTRASCRNEGLENGPAPGKLGRKGRDVLEIRT
jgi:hypothetical protein